MGNSISRETLLGHLAAINEQEVAARADREAASNRLLRILGAQECIGLQLAELDKPEPASINGVPVPEGAAVQVGPDGALNVVPIETAKEPAAAP